MNRELVARSRSFKKCYKIDDFQTRVILIILYTNILGHSFYYTSLHKNMNLAIAMNEPMEIIRNSSCNYPC